jgi:hypothetical protein
MDWIDLAQDRDQCRALVNMVMKLKFHKMFGICWVSAQLAASREGLSSMESVSLQDGLIAVSYGYGFARLFIFKVSVIGK